MAFRSQPAIQTAIREAQANGPVHTTRTFAKGLAAKSCVSYIVSIAGRRAVYFWPHRRNFTLSFFPSAK